MPTENRSSNTEMVRVPFVRENRYIAIKLKDLEAASDCDANAEEEVRHLLDLWNIKPRTGLVIESDWPEYEPTWAAIEARVTGKPAEQHQGEPVVLPARREWNGLGNAADNLKAAGWNACLMAVERLGPLYTHADPGEVERLSQIIRDLNEERDELGAEAGNLRAQQAETIKLITWLCNDIDSGMTSTWHAKLQSHLDGLRTSSK